MPPVTLLITSCINPGSAAGVVRSDPEKRMADYMASLQRWLTVAPGTIDRMVYVDNSGADLAPLARLADERVEFISTTNNEVPPGIHYGYPEVRMIDDALQKSDGLAHGRFVKVTGRLQFPGFERLLRRLPSDCPAAIDCRMKLRSRHRYATTQLMVFDADWYRRRLSGRLDWFRPEWGRTHAENFYYHHVAGHPEAILRFPVGAEPTGIGATTGADYGSLGIRAKAAVRATGRRLLPVLWL